MEFTLIFSQHAAPQMQIVNVLCDNVADMPRLYKAFQSLMTKSRVQLHTERIKGEAVVSKKIKNKKKWMEPAEEMTLMLPPV